MWWSNMSSHWNGWWVHTKPGPGDDGMGLNVDSHKHSRPSLILRGSFVYLTLHKLFWWISRPLTLWWRMVLQGEMKPESSGSPGHPVWVIKRTLTFFFLVQKSFRVRPRYYIEPSQHFFLTLAIQKSPPIMKSHYLHFFSFHKSACQIFVSVNQSISRPKCLPRVKTAILKRLKHLQPRHSLVSCNLNYVRFCHTILFWASILISKDVSVFSP